MSNDREKLYQAYHTMLSIALTWALVLGINQYFSLKVPIILSAVFSFLPVLIIYAFDLYKKNVISYIVMSSIILLMALIFWIKRFDPFRWCSEFFRWCGTYNGLEELHKAGYANFVVFGVGILGAVLFYLLMKKRIAEEVTAVVIMAALITLSITKVNVNKAVVSICVFYILTIVVELYGVIYSRKAGKQDKKEGILYLAPICLLLAVVSISIPSKSDPIKWQFVKNTYHNIVNQLEVWRTDLDYYFGNSKSEFFLKYSGYSDNSTELGNSDGELVKSNKTALKVSGIEKEESVYLIGSISDMYTGNSWEKSRKDYLAGRKDYFLDYSEIFYALARQDIEVLKENRFVEKKSIKINYNNIKTKTFFYPLKTGSFELFSEYKKLSLEAPQITFKKARGKGTSYQSSFFEMNLQGEAFVKMLRAADSFSYDQTTNINKEALNWIRNNFLDVSDMQRLTEDEDIYKTLGERAKLIKSQYTKLPEDLPIRVRELAMDITADYDNTYDKLKAIEQYLVQYKYSLQMQKMPEGADFVDYFLFERKEGYCTSFATAMAVLGRCIGVPTRFVEGYVARFEDKGKYFQYPVKNSQAHAWAEAYIEGVGWIPFEATAIYYNSRYTKWADITKNDTSEYVSPSYPYDMNQQDSKMYKPVEKVPKVVKKDKTIEIMNEVAILLVVIVSILLTAMIYYCILKYRYKKALGKADNSRKMYMMFIQILRLLKHEGFTLEQQETILMLSKRMKDHLCFEGIIFHDVANVYMRYRYANAEITNAELDKVSVFYMGLLSKAKEEQNRFKVWLEDFIFLTKRSYR